MVIRNMRGTTSAAAATIRAVGAGQRQDSCDHAGGLRSRDRARHVPARVVGRGLSRLLPDNTASVATWLDAGKPSHGGDLTLRKRSLVQIQYGPRHFSKSCIALGARIGATLLRLCPISAGHSVGISGLCISRPGGSGQLGALSRGRHRVRQPSRHPGTSRTVSAA